MSDLLSALLAVDKKPEKDVPLKRLGVTVRVKALDDKEIQRVNERATYGNKVDSHKQTLLLIQAGTVFDWSEKALLEHYGASDGIDVIDKALLPGEKVALVNEILSVSGFDQTMEKAIEQAKN